MGTPLVKGGSDVKFFMGVIGAFLFGLAIVGAVVAAAPTPPARSQAEVDARHGVTPEGRAKIEAYKAEEKNFRDKTWNCDPDELEKASLCRVTREQYAGLLIKHARWTLARRFGSEKWFDDVEAVWILKHADD